MAETKKCSSCGAELPLDAPGGHCPKCLLHFAIAPDEGAETVKLDNTIRIASVPEVQFSEKPGDRISHYKLLQKIGEGGMGIVWMAEQEEPVRRKVALKVVKLGMDTRQVIARFEAERQALALMDHPNIAKVLDAGATDTGRPYFVMELVRGIKITDYCDQHNLSTRERLDLFIKVCKAIQHAHQKGIIHRDIKPSNILVTMSDGLPMPKVIDFGIAKAITDQKLTDKTLFTAFEQFIGTPAYMSPEQAEMNAMDIDTRSDIYSLGVLLYELLTGKTPFETKELFAAGLDALRRLIREQEPQRPSTRLSTMQKDELTTTAKRRQSDPPKLVHLIQGDLDWIVMKTLEKDRTRRYQTANDLAADIQRHLKNELVTARPPSSLYKFQKMVRRNKVAFGAIIAVSTSIIIGLLVSTWLFLKEKHSHQQAVAAKESAQTEAQRANKAALDSKITLANSYFLQANRLIEEGARGDALAFLGKSLSLNPNHEAVLTRFTTLLTYHSWIVPKFTIAHTNRVAVAVTGDRDDRPNRLGFGVQVKFSPDGNSMLTVIGSEVRVWDAQTGLPLTDPMKQNSRWASWAQFSPNGKQILITSDNEARLWDAKTGKPLTPVFKHDAETPSLGKPLSRFQLSPDFIKTISAAAFTPDGKKVLTASRNEFHVWDAQTGESITKQLNFSSPVGAPFFSPDCKWVFSISTNEVRVWDTHNGEPLTEPIQGTIENPLSSFFPNGNQHSFSPNGNQFVIASRDTARLFDTQTGRTVAPPMQHNTFVQSAHFSPDGTRIITVATDAIREWDARNGQLLTALRDSKLAWSAQFSPDGKCILGRFAGTARLWDAETGEVQAGILKHGGFDPVVMRLPPPAFSPDGKRIITFFGDTARVWDAQTGQSLSEVMKHGNPVWGAQFSPDGKSIITITADGSVRNWVGQNVPPSPEILNHGSFLKSVRFSPDGKRVFTSSADDGTRPGGVMLRRFREDLSPNLNAARVWDAQTGLLLAEPLKQIGKVATVQFSPDGNKILTTTATEARIWDAKTGQPLTETLKHEGLVGLSEFSPDGKRILATFFPTNDANAQNFQGQSNRIPAVLSSALRVWDIKTSRLLADLKGHRTNSGAFLCARFSPDGKRIFTACANGTAQVWDAESGQSVTPLLITGAFRGYAQTTTRFSSAEFSPDGKRIATVLHGFGSILDAQTGRQLSSLQDAEARTSASFSHDGEYVLTSSGSSVRILDAHTGQPVTDFLKLEREVTSAKFSYDGKRVLTTSAEGTAQVWDAQTGQPLMEPIAGGTLPARFSPDGKRIITGSTNGVISIWDVCPATTNFPDWLLQLNEAVTGETLNKDGLLEPTKLNRIDVLEQIRRRLNQESDSGDWTVWGRWFLANPATRTISPFSTIKVSELIGNKINEGTRESLAEAERLANGDAGFNERISRASNLLEQKYSYASGYFQRLALSSPIQWREYKPDASPVFYFLEIKRDDNFILLKDRSRQMLIQLPVNGGMSRFSIDDGSTWNVLYEVRQESTAG